MTVIPRKTITVLTRKLRKTISNEVFNEKSKYNDSQIIDILKQNEQGVSVLGSYREHGIVISPFQVAKITRLSLCL